MTSYLLEVVARACSLPYMLINFQCLAQQSIYFIFVTMIVAIMRPEVPVRLLPFVYIQAAMEAHPSAVKTFDSSIPAINKLRIRGNKPPQSAIWNRKT